MVEIVWKSGICKPTEVKGQTIVMLPCSYLGVANVDFLVHSTYSRRQNEVPVPFSYYYRKTQGFENETTMELSSFRNYYAQNNALFTRYYRVAQLF